MLSHWSPYFAAVAGVFAALTGLVFVALSINLKPILATQGLTGRALEAIVLLVEPVLIGLTGLLPAQSAPTLGAEVLVFAVVGCVAVNTIMVVGRRAVAQRPLRERIQRILLAESAALVPGVAGALLAAGNTGGLYWLAAGIALCLVVSITDAWVLLVEIMR